MILTEQDAQQIHEALQTQVPWLQVQRSTLGGEARATIMITLSFDPKESWSYGIFHNSRHAMFSLEHTLTLEKFSGSQTPKFRLARPQTIQDAIVKLYAYIVKVKALTEAAN